VLPEKQISELEFAYPVGHLDPGKLNSFLERSGRRVPRLTFPVLDGYLLGFIDLVFEHRGRWYVLDWKSNKIGTKAEDYSRGRLDEAMFRHAYELQALIYLTALHRYLKVRLPDYDYSVHMGGVFYLFVRGVRPEWPSAGIWHDLPDPALIESLDAIFSSASAGEGRRPS
jgi:exodeoxyribonuclease V beta subunit